MTTTKRRMATAANPVEITGTPLELIDRAIAYFSRPGAKQAYSEEDYECVYRTPDGHRCAVGCLLPDDVDLPNGSIERLHRAGSVVTSESLLPVLRDMQVAHDSESDATDIVFQLEKLRTRYAAGGEA